MPTATHLRADLIQHGCEAHHTHVALWVARDGQSEIVVGLGTSADEARADAARVEAEGNYTIDGGSIRVDAVNA